MTIICEREKVQNLIKPEIVNLNKQFVVRDNSHKTLWSPFVNSVTAFGQTRKLTVVAVVQHSMHIADGGRTFGNTSWSQSPPTPCHVERISPSLEVSGQRYAFKTLGPIWSRMHMYSSGNKAMELRRLAQT